MSEDMRRNFDNRDELIGYLKEEFLEAHTIDPNVSDEFIGGRKAAEERLQQTDGGRNYQNTRNYIDGGVSRLSPYIRYGVLNLAEVRDFVLQQVDKPNDAYKFINELSWRDYWQRLYQQIGNEIWENQEPYKTGYMDYEYADDLPDDIQNGTTGVKLIDNIVQELRETGYLHNRYRMYFASYVVHWRGVKWQTGARFFLIHLLDGDPASNNLSWQWVASTFSHKPYIFNLGNVRKYTGDTYKAPAEEIGMQDFATSYDDINKQLFRKHATS